MSSVPTTPSVNSTSPAPADTAHPATQAQSAPAAATPSTQPAADHPSAATTQPASSAPATTPEHPVATSDPQTSSAQPGPTVQAVSASQPASTAPATSPDASAHPANANAAPAKAPANPASTTNPIITVQPVQPVPASTVKAEPAPDTHHTSAAETTAEHQVPEHLTTAIVPERARSPSSSSVQRPIGRIEVANDLAPHARSRRDSLSENGAGKSEHLELPQRLSSSRTPSSSDLRSGLASPIIPTGAVE